MNDLAGKKNTVGVGPSIVFIVLKYNIFKQKTVSIKDKFII